MTTPNTRKIPLVALVVILFIAFLRVISLLPRWLPIDSQGMNTIVLTIVIVLGVYALFRLVSYLFGGQ